LPGVKEKQQRRKLANRNPSLSPQSKPNELQPGA
jgi:hypothetical protein